MKLAMILLALIVTSEQPAPPRAGVMVTTTGRSVLAIGGPTLATGTIITLVTIDNPQQVSWAVIADRLADSEIMAKHYVSAPYYAVTAAPVSNVLPHYRIRASAIKT